MDDEECAPWIVHRAALPTARGQVCADCDIALHDVVDGPLAYLELPDGPTVYIPVPAGSTVLVAHLGPTNIIWPEHTLAGDRDRTDEIPCLTAEGE